MLRSVETQPLTGGFVMLVWRILQVIRDGSQYLFFLCLFFYISSKEMRSLTLPIYILKRKKKKKFASSSRFGYNDTTIKKNWLWNFFHFL